MSNIMVWVMLSLLLVINAGGVVLTVFQLPGIWLILLATGLTFIWQPQIVGYEAVLVLAILAIGGEVLEFWLAARGAVKAGGSTRAAACAMVGAVVGAMVGTIVFPVVGTIVGGCLGAGLASYLGDRWAGRTHDQAAKSGGGAVTGKFWATLMKVAVAIAMWIVSAVVVFWS